MAAVRGIFSISDATFLKKNNYWTDLAQVWINQIPDNAYFGRSSIDKIQYSTDSVSQLPSAVRQNSSDDGIGNSTSGYFAGGPAFPSPGTKTTVDKIFYSIDLSQTLPSTLNVALGDHAAGGSSTAGYFAGGYIGSGSPVLSSISKLTYSTELISPLPATLTISAYSPASASSSTAAYFSGGSPSIPFGFIPQSSITNKLTFSSDTVAAIPGASLSSEKTWAIATGNSTAGYFAGGRTGVVSHISIDKITYSTDTRSTLFYKTFGTDVDATGNSTSGYFRGNEKYTYSSDTYSTLNISLRNNSCAVSPKEHFLDQNNWRRFSDGTTTTNPASVPQETPTPRGITTTIPVPNSGYLSGGGGFSSVNRLDFATETLPNVPSANFPSGNSIDGAVGDTAKGYFHGNSGGVNVYNKLDYITELSSSLPYSNWGQTWVTGTGNSAEGYFGGGKNTFPSAGSFSNFLRVNYSTGSYFTLPLLMSIGRYAMSSASSSSAGYFGGGESFVSPSIGTRVYSTIDKINYITSTSAILPSGFLSTARRRGVASGNLTGGYFSSGNAADFPTRYSTTDKITYSTDTVTTPTAAALHAAKYNGSATGNSTAGYIMGGNGPTVSTLVDKITYSTDTRSQLPGSTFSPYRSKMAAVSAKQANLPSTPISTTSFYTV